MILRTATWTCLSLGWWMLFPLQATSAQTQKTGTLDSIPSISEFNQVLGLTTIRRALEDRSQRVTIFAPDNDAMATVPAYLVQQPQWIKHLEDVIRYHVYSFSARSSAELSGNPLRMSNQENVTIQNILGSISLQDTQGDSVSIVDADYITGSSNIPPIGYIHVLSDFLKPSFLETTLAQALTATGEHTILLELIASVPNFITTEYTLFAPTDVAFAQLDSATLNNLRNNNQALANILRFHVVDSLHPSPMLTNGSLETMLSGESFQVAVVDGGSSVSVNGVTVTRADILTKDGLIHSMDAVLMPPVVPTAAPSGMPSRDPMEDMPDTPSPAMPISPTVETLQPTPTMAFSTSSPSAAMLPSIVVSFVVASLVVLSGL